ncbi:hypothetical protein SAMN04488000_10726 [Lentzea albida]|uniref:Uncharacterized protein n=1 Tax=Lentzea albida TaxID=65499 RepID=A0A1H9MGH2_9PSEU|nr:hypothetical protein SAMN04488000_10726 [Lentzea albida]
MTLRFGCRSPFWSEKARSLDFDLALSLREVTLPPARAADLPHISAGRGRGPMPLRASRPLPRSRPGTVRYTRRRRPRAGPSLDLLRPAGAEVPTPARRPYVECRRWPWRGQRRGDRGSNWSIARSAPRDGGWWTPCVLLTVSPSSGGRAEAFRTRGRSTNGVGSRCCHLFPLAGRKAGNSSARENLRLNSMADPLPVLVRPTVGAGPGRCQPEQFQGSVAGRPGGEVPTDCGRVELTVFLSIASVKFGDVSGGRSHKTLK